MTLREFKRRLIHLGLGAGAFLLPVLGWKVVAGLALVATCTNALILPRLNWTSFLLRDAKDRGLLGLILYPMVVLGLVLVFRDWYVPTQAGWLALAIGDGLAPIFGMRLKSPRWPWNHSKSIPASVSAFVVASAVMVLIAPLHVALFAGLLGLIGETLPKPINDNLSVPFGAALGAALLTGGLA